MLTKFEPQSKRLVMLNLKNPLLRDEILAKWHSTLFELAKASGQRFWPGELIFIKQNSKQLILFWGMWSLIKYLL